eukprot:5205474-Prymnesium_polylepis.1
MASVPHTGCTRRVGGRWRFANAAWLRSCLPAQQLHSCRLKSCAEGCAGQAWTASRSAVAPRCARAASIPRGNQKKLTGVSRVRPKASFPRSDFDRTSFPMPASAFLIVCDQEWRLQKIRPSDAPVPTPPSPQHRTRECSIPQAH